MRTIARNLVAVAWLTLVAGCASLDPGADPVVVRAEQTAAVSADVLTAFVTWARVNEATLGDDVKLAANRVREKAPGAIDSLRRATKAYKSNRSEENKATLLTWLMLVEQIQAEAINWFGPVPVVTPGPTPPQ